MWPGWKHGHWRYSGWRWILTHPHKAFLGLLIERMTEGVYHEEFFRGYNANPEDWDEIAWRMLKALVWSPRNRL